MRGAPPAMLSHQPSHDSLSGAADSPGSRLQGELDTGPGDTGKRPPWPPVWGGPLSVSTLGSSSKYSRLQPAGIPKNPTLKLETTQGRGVALGRASAAAEGGNAGCLLAALLPHQQVALDDISDANTRHVKNWAWSFRRSLRAVGYEFAFTTLLPICLGTVLQLLDAPTAQLLGTLDICPRTFPSQNATLCTNFRWFAKPRRPKSLLQLPISSRCMSVFLTVQDGLPLLANCTW